VRALLTEAALPGEAGALESRLLLGHCLGKPQSWLYAWPEASIDAPIISRYRALLERRRAGEPVAYLLGEREFWSLPLQVSPACLIPRPETELLVQWALALPLVASAAVLDLGTGSGAIALALASERPQWCLSAVDSSAEAVALARHNAQRLGLARVQVLVSDWFEAVAGRRFDLLLSNPPYIDAADPHLGRGDLRFEPRTALVSAEAGLADLRRLVEQAPAFLHPGGYLLLEHGCTQGAAVRALLQARGFAAVQTRTDLAGLERATGGCWCGSE
jgi:release factor glutamine methyltransferase